MLSLDRQSFYSWLWKVQWTWNFKVTKEADFKFFNFKWLDKAFKLLRQLFQIEIVGVLLRKKGDWPYLDQPSSGVLFKYLFHKAD